MTRRIAPTSVFIKRYLIANNVSQRQLAVLTGYTEKQISLILNDKAPVTERFANEMSNAIKGIKADFILKYYNSYQEQLKRDKEFLDNNRYSAVSKQFNFKKVFKHITKDPVEQTQYIQEAFKIDNLNQLPNVLDNRHLYTIAAFSKDTAKLNDKDNDIVTIWTKIVMDQILINKDKKKFVGGEKARSILIENKELLNVTDSNDLIMNIEYICDLCGIHVGFSKSAPTTYIKGLCFSMDGQLFIVLTDRYKKIESVVFAFVHEITHIIRGDVNIESDVIRYIDDSEELEQEVDEEAFEFLIPQDIYKAYWRNKNQLTATDIFNIAKESRCSIGLVVSKIQHDTKDYACNWQKLSPFKIEQDMFGN